MIQTQVASIFANTNSEPLMIPLIKIKPSFKTKSLESYTTTVDKNNESLFSRLREWF